MKSSNLFGLLFTSVALVSIFSGIHFYRLHEEKTRTMMLKHCANINDDITRPAERECVYPIELDDNHFVFINRGGRKERYEVVSTQADVYTDSNNLFYYNFIGFGEE